MEGHISGSTGKMAENVALYAVWTLDCIRNAVGSVSTLELMASLFK